MCYYIHKDINAELILEYGHGNINLWMMSYVWRNCVYSTLYFLSQWWWVVKFGAGHLKENMQYMSLVNRVIIVFIVWFWDEKQHHSCVRIVSLPVEHFCDVHICANWTVKWIKDSSYELWFICTNGNNISINTYHIYILVIGPQIIYHLCYSHWSG